MKSRNRLAAAASTIGAALGGYGLVVLGIVAFTVLGLIAWGITVALSGAVGAGNVHKDQNSARNREYWSAKFNTDMQQLQADETNLPTLRDAATGPGATQQDRQNYLGALQNCRQDAATYNADAGNVLAAPWIPAGLPATVSADTYCPAGPLPTDAPTPSASATATSVPTGIAPSPSPTGGANPTATSTSHGG